MIKQYIRNKNGQPIGCLVAEKQGDKYAIGFSKCRKGDKFDKKFGTEVAQRRANMLLHHDRYYEIPHSIADAYQKMSERAARLFKDSNLIQCPIKKG
jgi:hypothetical protein